MSRPISIRPGMRRLLDSSLSHQIPPTFLLPSLLGAATQTSSFSSSTSNAFPRRDMNRQRGESTLRRTGPKYPLSVSKTTLPKPMLDKSRRSEVRVDENHGLWDFFHSKDKAMNTPEEDDAHGRAWALEELRGKSWEDLHSLWWVCAKERNRIATERYERQRVEAGYGDHESEGREREVKITQKRIKQALTERYYSWREAEVIAKDDSEINLSSNGPVYNPGSFEDEQEQDYEEPEELMEPEEFQQQEVKPNVAGNIATSDGKVPKRRRLRSDKYTKRTEEPATQEIVA